MTRIPGLHPSGCQTMPKRGVDTECPNRCSHYPDLFLKSGLVGQDEALQNRHECRNWQYGHEQPHSELKLLQISRCPMLTLGLPCTSDYISELLPQENCWLDSLGFVRRGQKLLKCATRPYREPTLAFCPINSEQNKPLSWTHQSTLTFYCWIRPAVSAEKERWYFCKCKWIQGEENFD